MRQRGVISADLAIAGGAVLLLVAIIAGALWYAGEQRDEGYSSGEQAERLKWQQRESKELVAANKDLVDALAKVRALEQKAATDIGALEAKHEEELANAHADHDRFVDDLVAGRVRFRADLTACQGAGGHAASPATAGAGERDGQARGELPPALARIVARGDALATEADAVVLQLHEAQGVIESDRRTCNGGAS